MLIKTPAELVKKLNELRHSNSSGYTHVRIIKPKSASHDQQDDENIQSLPGEQDND